nr:MAG TPA: hypothetical protein [Caudoviricetes sp.]
MIIVDNESLMMEEVWRCGWTILLFSRIEE